MDSKRECLPGVRATRMVRTSPGVFSPHATVQRRPVQPSLAPAPLCPNAAPVWRNPPAPAPLKSALQMKDSGKRLAAPPVYRPQPHVPVAQRKLAAALPVTSGQIRPAPAPPVYRPCEPLRVAQRGAVGTRSFAPSRPALPTRQVYRPQPLVRVAQGKAAPRGIQPGGTPLPANSRRVIQPFTVLPPTKIFNAMPGSRPWGGYPYAVVSGATFSAQARGALGGGNEFLTVGGAANAVNHPGGLSLRVSDNSDIAIEESDLVNRQPKVFYATQAVVTEANGYLQRSGSGVRLMTGAVGLTILTGWWWGDRQLVAVTPTRLDGDHNPDALPQNCNAVAATITGMNALGLASQGFRAAENMAKSLAPTNTARFEVARRRPIEEVSNAALDVITDDIAREYVTNQTEENLRAARANRYAQPEVGDAFVIATIGKGTDLGGGRNRVRDYETNTNRDLGWAYHFAGVVARSGKDRITLENYARPDARAEAADPRWYFQMYGEKQGQSFHEFHKARNDYANPATVVFQGPNAKKAEAEELERALLVAQMNLLQYQYGYG